MHAIAMSPLASSIPSIVFLLIITLVSYCSAAAPTYIYRYCPANASFPTTDSVYRSNIHTLLTSLSSAANRSSTPPAGFFYNFTVGSGDSAVYGLYLCRGDDDLATATCRDCVSKGSAILSENCPLAKQAVVWYDECMVRYSKDSIFGALDVTYEGARGWNVKYITTNVTGFSQVLDSTLDMVARDAPTTSAYFATDKAGFGDNGTVYTLAQCTQDLSVSDCSECLRLAYAQLFKWTYKGGRILFFSCNLRYEIYNFYRTVTMPASAPAPAPHSTLNRTVSGPVPALNVNASGGRPVPARNVTAGGGKMKLVIGVVAAVAAAGLLLLVAIICLVTGKKKAQGVALNH